MRITDEAQRHTRTMTKVRDIQIAKETKLRNSKSNSKKSKKQTSNNKISKPKEQFFLYTVPQFCPKNNSDVIHLMDTIPFQYE